MRDKRALSGKSDRIGRIKRSEGSHTIEPLTFHGALAIDRRLLVECATKPSTDVHAAHHAEGGLIAASTPSDKYDHQMKMLQDMHSRTTSVQTPEERQALPDDHMKAMQGGTMMMHAMGRMGPRGSGTYARATQQDMMDRCMKMHDMMMRMMMNRQAPPAALQ